jgi:LPS O-antigen subunit length determinant protein (WzzB/FepE family)
VPPLARFRSGNPNDRLRDLLAFAIATEEGKPLGPEGLEALHRRADSELSAHAVRYLHNRIDEIRREAQEELRAKTRRPAGFLTLVLANLIGFLLGTGVLLYALWHLGGLD